MSQLSYYFEMAQRIQLRKLSPMAWNYLKYKLLKKQAYTAVKRYSPQIGGILVTGRCNLNCDYCNAANFIETSKGKWPEYEATLEKVTRIMDNPLYARCVLIDLVGGEPLVNKEIVPIVALLHKRGHLVNMATNGLLLLKRIEELKTAGIARINLSIYETNRKVWEQDLPQINRVFPVHTSLVLLKSMLADPEKIVATVRTAKAAGCLSLRFWMFRPMGTRDTGEVIHSDDPALLAFRQVLDAKMPGFCFWPTVVQPGKAPKRCVQLWQRVNCNARGEVTLCCGSEQLLSGPDSNLYDADPDALYNNPVMVGMRANFLNEAIEPPAICRNCNLLGEPGW